MKKAKLLKQSKKKEIKSNNEGYSIKQLSIIILVLTIVFVIFDFITTLIVKNEKGESLNSSTQIDSTKIIMNNLLDRKESEYYVLAYKESLYKNYSKANYTTIYNQYISDYNDLTFYRVDLDDALNKNYFSEESNIVSDLKELKVSDEILFKIVDGKIEEYYEGSGSIIEALSNLKES